MGTWTYAVVYDHAVVGYYKSWWKAKARAAHEREKIARQSIRQASKDPSG